MSIYPEFRRREKVELASGQRDELRRIERKDG